MNDHLAGVFFPEAFFRFCKIFHTVSSQTAATKGIGQRHSDCFKQVKLLKAVAPMKRVLIKDTFFNH